MASGPRTPTRMFASALYSTTWFIVIAALVGGAGKGCVIYNKNYIGSDGPAPFFAALGSDAVQGLIWAAGFFLGAYFVATLGRKWSREPEPAAAEEI